jgi:hypothetical protein
MASADFRLVRPVAVVGDVAFTRASPKWVFDRTGMLVQVPVNTLGMTYDPSDLSKAPRALIETTTSTNLWTWSNDLTQGAWSPAYVSVQSVVRANAFGANVSRVTPDSSAGLHFVGRNSVPTLTAWLPYSATFVVASSSLRAAVEFFDGSAYRYVTADLVAGKIVSTDGALAAKLSGPDAFGFYTLAVTGTVASTSGTSRFTLFAADVSGLNFAGSGAQFLDVAFAQLEQGAPSSLMPTNGATTTRAVDVIAPGAGLVHSNVPIVEVQYSAATTYAKDVVVYDPVTYLTYQSAVAGNVGHALTDTNSWTPLKKVVNRRMMFDKVVNSQTTAANEATVVIRPGELVNTLGLLNVNGSSVTVTQTDSGYSQTKSLVRHDVLSWYDWFYEEPIREGDVIFDGIPPYANSALSISVINPGDTAAIGCCILGKARTIGQTAWDFTGGILSYSTSSTDTFGNVTMVKRDNSKVLNFEVYVPKGYESEAYRLLSKEYTDVEIMVIGAEDYSMTFAYGFLGQWNVPVSAGGDKTAHIEFKGLA